MIQTFRLYLKWWKWKKYTRNYNSMNYIDISRIVARLIFSVDCFRTFMSQSPRCMFMILLCENKIVHIARIAVGLKLIFNREYNQSSATTMCLLYNSSASKILIIFMDEISMQQRKTFHTFLKQNALTDVDRSSNRNINDATVSMM